jgi:hypothetical protein
MQYHWSHGNEKSRIGQPGADGAAFSVEDVGGKSKPGI